MLQVEGVEGFKGGGLGQAHFDFVSSALTSFGSPSKAARRMGIVAGGAMNSRLACSVINACHASGYLVSGNMSFKILTAASRSAMEMVQRSVSSGPSAMSIAPSAALEMEN
jgi:hypothetical protein